MTDAEKLLLKGFAHEISDKLLPQLIDTEVAKLPAEYGAIVQLIVKALEPALIAKLDAYIDSK